MKRKVVSITLAAAMTAGMLAGTAAVSAEENLDYTYGLGETFHSDEPVTYSIMFSDASWYPMTEEWKTEGIFEKITEYTNVTLDISAYDSGDYDNKKSLLINAGSAPYIIPKTYDESAFVDGGAIVPISDYTQYMPNYTDFVEKYNFEPDLETIEKADGKYYRLPGMNETAIQDYTFLLRKDIFDAAGYDVAELEKDWTWDDFYDVLEGVKKYMVEQGMIDESAYVWSDLWAGSEITDGSGGNILKLIGATYGVPSGWAIGNGTAYDADSDEFYFASTTDDYKEFVTTVRKFVDGGLLDPETFTQDNQTACNKFYRGETALLSVNRSQYVSWLANMDENLGEGNYETYLCVIPKGSNDYKAENQRLENGVMISQNALDDLGEEDFIKMLRFVDWLFYSDEAYDLTKWGVEGETYQVNEDGTKSLLDGYCCSGLGIAGEEGDTDIRLKWGYAGGNYFYGGTVDEITDNFNPAVMDFVKRENEYRETKPLDPAYAADEDDNEQLNLWKTPLIDNVNTWTLQFITGVKDVDADWDEYVASCEGLNSTQMVELINEIYESGK